MNTTIKEVIDNYLDDRDYETVVVDHIDDNGNIVRTTFKVRKDAIQTAEIGLSNE